MTAHKLDIPPAWVGLDLRGLSGMLMVIGAPNTGKSTFAEYLYRRLAAEGSRPAFLDGDPGQSRLGPPTTMTLALGAGEGDEFPPQGRTWRRFVGSTSPSGHMLPVLVGAQRLVEAARGAGARLVIYDTSGLVDPAQGGAALKQAKIDLLQPAAVFALQREAELEALLMPLRRSQRVRVVGLQPSRAVLSRDMPARQVYRAARFGEYFREAGRLKLDWSRLAVFPYPRFALNRLVAFEDRQGFTLGLGIVAGIARAARQVSLLTPLASLDGVDALRLGDMVVDMQTFRDERIG